MNNKFLLIILAAFCSCSRENPVTRFSLVPSEATQIHFNNLLVETDSFNMVEYLYFNDGGGVAAGDINNDGLVDLYFTSNQQDNKLYLNKGNFIFEDITGKAGVGGTNNWDTGVTMADVNGDGLLDIYISCLGDYKGKKGHNQLFINNGNLAFTEKSKEYGLGFIGYSVQAAFFDFDLDGDLDVYLLNNSVHSNKTYGDASLRYEFDNYAGDRLFRNDMKNGSPFFVDITRQSGIFSSQIGYGLSISIADINNDGYPDIYVANDFHENDYLYINNRNSTFSERLTQMIAHTSRSSMGNDIADFNNDGLLDILVLDMLPEDESIRKRSAGEDDYDLYKIKLNNGYYYQFVRNTLQLNLGNNVFSEIGRLAGVSSTDWSWSPLFCDLDNDGWKDVFITNGIYRRANDLDYINFLSNEPMARSWENTKKFPDKMLYEKMPLDPLVNYAYKNNRDLTFTNMAKEWGMDQKSFSNGSCYADLDNDGDLDLVINNINAEAFIYRNNTEKLTKNHFLQFSFNGPPGNRFGIGSRVALYCKGQIRVAENYTTRGFQSSVPPLLHFGTGDDMKVDSALILWPGGYIQKLTDLQADKRIRVDFSNAGPMKDKNNSPGKHEKLFSKVKDFPGLNYKHIENRYIDFNTELLIPHSLSAEGPCIAVGDLNGDGLQDIFIGGAKGQEAGLFMQDRSGFTEVEQEAFYKDAMFEDVDAAFFDADNDGDLDLYVVSGGNEHSGNNPFMRDRLYLNDGHANFKAAWDNLPVFYHNGSCVKPFDFDKDGDMDLFVGSRSVPKAYGSSPFSYLLENDGNGTFSDITNEKAKDITNVGMVTDAAWADFNNDGNPDLAVTGEWMPVQIFINKNGQLSSDNDENGLKLTGGWWFSLEASDIDLDGDMDLIAGNLGLNAGITANEREPASIYINDFDNNGIPDPIISYYRQGGNYPAASTNDLIKQIISLQKKYKNYTDFAGKTVEEIFPPDKLKKSTVKKAYNFQSCLFINQGNGKFITKPLPVEVQFSPVMNILCDDFDNDSIPDLLVAGNFYNVQPSMGRYDASYGWFLKGMGSAEFKVEYPVISGLFIKGEVKAMEQFRYNGKRFILVGINDEDIQVFQVESDGASL